MTVFWILYFAFFGSLFPGVWLVANRWRFRRPSSAAVAVATLLTSDPDGWVRNSHVWTHAVSGIHVWVANQDYALRWWMGRDTEYHHPWPPKEDQRHVWNALRPIMANVTQDFARKALDALRTAPVTGAANVVRLRQ